MASITPHLSWEEVLRGSGVDSIDGLPPGVEEAIRKMAEVMFEPIRNEWGAGLRVVSGYRTPDKNRRVGGARNSMHVRGLALDLVPVGEDGRFHVEALHALADRMQRDGRIPPGGLGLYLRADGSGRFSHVDCRGHLARWRSQRKDGLEA